MLSNKKNKESMFDSVSPKPQKPTSESLNANDAVDFAQNKAILGDPEARSSVYTLPKEFLPKTPVISVKSGFSWKWALIIAGVILVVVGGAAAAIIIVLNQAQKNEPVAYPFPNTNSQNKNQNSANENTNNGTTLNLNANSNLSSNINAELFPNQNSGNTNTSAQVGVREFVNRTVVPLAADKDRDGLTDAEEVLYGTKVGLPDTDNDGYVDGAEVLKGYSPLTAAKTLSQDGITLVYNNSAFGWKMDYPAKWIAGASDSDQRSVLFTSDSVEGEFIQISMTDNPNGLAAKDWYKSLFTQTDINSLQQVTVAGLSGIVSPDGYSYYLADDNYIIGITYNFGTKNIVTFKTTFQMMLSTLVYNPAAKPKAETNTAAPVENTNVTVNTNTATVNTNTTSNTNTSGRNQNTNTTTSNTNQVRTIQAGQ